MSREKQIEAESAEMLDIIEKAREIYANDVTDRSENEYIREGLLDAGYRKQSDVAREIFDDIEGVRIRYALGTISKGSLNSMLCYYKEKYTEGKT